MNCKKGVVFGEGELVAGLKDVLQNIHSRNHKSSSSEELYISFPTHRFL